ncbi:hypothetical protein ACN27F_18075 [Solwaraspora sp. WMMB335]|uniref:hypothetical protein n=1 Tax=Solwaraspora sp. WMMB335 TaxID=3404118 RepID=UPI003B932A7C
MQAATHAAGGVGASVGPRVHAARDAVAPTAARVRTSAADGMSRTMATLAPLAVAAADGARQAGRATRSAKGRTMKAAKPARMKAMKAKAKKTTFTPSGGKGSGRRWPLVVGVLAAGAAIGTLVVRRRRAAQWEEYDPGQALDSMRAAATATHESDAPEATEPSGTPAAKATDKATGQP